MLITLTNTHAVRGRPTLKDIERFRNGSVRELSENTRKLKRHSMISNGRNDRAECEETTRIVEKSLSTGVCKGVNIVRICRAGGQCKNSVVFFESERNKRISGTKLCSVERTDSQQRKMENNYFTVVPLVVNIVIFLIVLILFRKVSAQIVVFFLRVILFHIILYFGTMHICVVRDCASSAKSVVIEFDDIYSEVSEKAMQVTLPSVRKENGVAVKINVIELRSRHAKFIFKKNNSRVGYRENRFRVCEFRRGRAPSRIPVKKLKRLSQKARKIRVFVWKCIRKNTPLSSKIHGYLGCASGYLNRYSSNVARFVPMGTKKLISKGVYLFDHSRRGARTMDYQNRVLRKYLPLCTCNYPLSVYKSFNHRVVCRELKLCNDIEKNPGPFSVQFDVTKTICAPYSQGNVSLFGQNAGQQCVAMSLCALLYNKIRTITSPQDMIEIMNVGNQLYGSLSLLTRQSFLLLSELPTMVTVFEQCFQLEYSESYTGNIQGDARIEGYEYCMPLSRALETILSLNYESMILTVGCISVGIYSIDNGRLKLFDSHARDVIVILKEHVYC